MDPDLTTALIGFGGALGGSAVGFGGVLLESRRAERRAERDQLKTLYADFLGAVERNRVARRDSARADANVEALDADTEKEWRVRTLKEAIDAVNEVIATSHERLTLYKQVTIFAPEQTWNAASRLNRLIRDGDEEAVDDAEIAFIVRAQIDLATTRSRRKWAEANHESAKRVLGL